MGSLQPQRRLGPEIAGPLARMWAGGAGSTADDIETAFTIAGLDPRDVSGPNKQARVRNALLLADDATALKLIKELIDTLRYAGAFESEVEGYARKAQQLKDRLLELDLDLDLDARGNLRGLGDYARRFGVDYDDQSSQTNRRQPSGRAPFGTASPIAAGREKDDMRAAAPAVTSETDTKTASGGNMTDDRSVFLVHGHNTQAKYEVAYFLTRVTGHPPSFLMSRPTRGGHSWKSLRPMAEQRATRSSCLPPMMWAAQRAARRSPGRGRT